MISLIIDINVFLYSYYLFTLLCIRNSIPWYSELNIYGFIEQDIPHVHEKCVFLIPLQVGL